MIYCDLSSYNHSGFPVKSFWSRKQVTRGLGFFPISTAKTMEGGGGYCGLLNNDKEDEDAGHPSLYVFHFSH